MIPYRLDVVSLVPQAFAPLLEIRKGVIGRAFANGIAELYAHDLRNYATGRYRKVDDEPYGGGAGMVLKPEPVYAAVESIPRYSRRRVLLMTPQGCLLQQQDLCRWANETEQLVLICGQYEGFDERIRALADEEISVGDFVLTGGELPAMTVINGVVRLLPGTVGTITSLKEESHIDLLLEHPHYTRPATFRGQKVPMVLRSGNHNAIALWRQRQRELRTQQRRPDLHERWLVASSSGATQAMNMQRGSQTMSLRIGNGYDIHRLVPGRPLILGGIQLEHPDRLGLDGHSDADVLVHAVMDALLGALSLGDIGCHFPPDDRRWQGADSLLLLEWVVELVHNRGWQIINVDSVIIAERPKLKPYINSMRANIAAHLDIDPDVLGIKATTNERLGPEGREEGISSQAVVLLQSL